MHFYAKRMITVLLVLQELSSMSTNAYRYCQRRLGCLQTLEASLSLQSYFYAHRRLTGPLGLQKLSLRPRKAYSHCQWGTRLPTDLGGQAVLTEAFLRLMAPYSPNMLTDTVSKAYEVSQALSAHT